MCTNLANKLGTFHQASFIVIRVTVLSVKVETSSSSDPTRPHGAGIFYGFMQAGAPVCLQNWFISPISRVYGGYTGYTYSIL